MHNATANGMWDIGEPFVDEPNGYWDYGEKFTDQNIKVVRPGYGLKPKFYNNILGKISKIKISTGTAINWKMIK